MKGIITTNSGIHFDIQHPTVAMITVEDIACHLSKLCRFTGALDEFYSVTQHSIYCSYLVPDKYALLTLMHDAAEAYLGDVAKPLKELMPVYQRLEGVVWNAICHKFGLPFVLPPEAKYADAQAYVKERFTHLSASPVDEFYHKNVKMPVAALPSHKLSPGEVATGFLRRFHELTSER